MGGTKAHYFTADLRKIDIPMLVMHGHRGGAVCGGRATAPHNRVYGGAAAAN